MVAECGWIVGDCKAVPRHPGCYVGNSFLIGDGLCDGDEYNMTECGCDGGDC